MSKCFLDPRSPESLDYREGSKMFCRDTKEIFGQAPQLFFYFFYNLFGRIDDEILLQLAIHLPKL